MRIRGVPNASTLFCRLPRFLRRHRLMSAWITFTGQSPIQLVPIIGDVWGYADLREGFLRLIVIDGSFESDFFSLARAIFPQSGTFFDVGANFGLMTVGMAGAVAPSGHYHLFEPNAELTPIIARSLARLNSVNARINTAAVSDCTKPVLMQFNSSHTGASYVSSSGTEVSSIRLDDYITEQNIRQIDLMKIDVEGYEAVVLKSMPNSLRNGTVRAIYFEYVQKWIARYGTANDVLQLLYDSGFKVFYCCPHDLRSRPGDTQTLRLADGNATIPVVEVDVLSPPEETDLLAVHRSHLDG